MTKNNMKAMNSIIISLLAGLLTLSCEALPREMSSERVEVSFDASVRTKAELPSDGQIRSLDILVYREGGLLEAWTRREAESISISVLRGGQYRWYLVANAPEGLDLYVREQDFLAARSLLQESGMTAPVMVGSGSGVFLSDTFIKARLDRVVSKVTLESVTADFLRDSYQGAAVRLERVFLLNACGTVPYSMIPAADFRLNETALWTLPGSSLGDLLCSERDALLTADRHEDGTSLLCCPDPEELTRLVVEVSIDGQSNYYPVKLPPMACNTEYIVKDLVLLGPGSSLPCEDVSRTDLSFSVEVSAWEDEDKEVYFN